MYELHNRIPSALHPDRVRELLALWRGLAADLTRWIHRVLRLNSGHDLRHGDGELCQLIGFYPQPHGVPARAKHLNAADSGNAAQLVVKIDVRVVRQEL